MKTKYNTEKYKLSRKFSGIIARQDFKKRRPMPVHSLEVLAADSPPAIPPYTPRTTLSGGISDIWSCRQAFYVCDECALQLRCCR